MLAPRDISMADVKIPRTFPLYTDLQVPINMWGGAPFGTAQVESLCLILFQGQ
jgi:hypothetical protein